MICIEEKMMNNNIFTHVETSDLVLCKIRDSLPDFLTEKRLLHTLSVEDEALKIARKLFKFLNIDIKYLNDISASCLLHDITKKDSLQSQQKLCHLYNIETDYISYSSCNLLHSKTASFLSRELFGINDIVFSAIYNHTTGKENMNVFDKIVFLSDYIEPTRTHVSCIKTREKFYSELDCNNDLLSVLDKAVLLSLNNTLTYLINSEKPTDIQTIKARNYLLTQLQSQTMPERNGDFK